MQNARATEPPSAMPKIAGRHAVGQIAKAPQEAEQDGQSDRGALRAETTRE